MRFAWEWAVYRTLGASRKLLRVTLWNELALLGLVARAVAAIGARLVREEGDLVRILARRLHDGNIIATKNNQQSDNRVDMARTPAAQ